MSSEVLAIIGGLVTFLLSINGWYFRSIVTTLTEIKVTLAQLTESHDNNLQLVSKHDKEIDILRERIHKLEGLVPSLLQDFKHRNIDN